MWKALIVATIGAWSPIQAGAVGQCDGLMLAYENASKAASVEVVSSALDNSAPRASLAEQKINNSLLVKQMNLQLMIQWKCPMPSDPVTEAEYFGSALACLSARSKGTSMVPGEKSPEPSECNRQTWRKGFATK